MVYRRHPYSIISFCNPFSNAFFWLFNKQMEIEGMSVLSLIITEVLDSFPLKLLFGR